MNVTGAPWKTRNLYLPESLPKAITEPLKVIAPIERAEEQLEPVAGRDRIAPPRGDDAERVRLDHRGDGDEHRRQADQLWKNATSSGISVISTVCARQAP